MSAPRVAAIQMTTSADVGANLAQAAHWLAQAADRGAVVAALPENFAFMGLADADKRAIAEEPGAGPIQDFLADAALRHSMMVIGGTVPLRVVGGDGRVAAACLVFDTGGRAVARYDKIHLFDVELPAAGESYLESAHVAPGHAPQVIDTPAGRLGLAVCYDVRFPELFRRLVAGGAEWFVLPSAFTVPTGQAHWETLLRARAIENLAFMVAPAQSGRHANGRLTHGNTLICDFWGRILGRLESGPGCVVAEFDRAAQADARARFPALRHRVL
ncbi:MAG TPA: carbon-nitrogen hydrolase family protein [Steroidobacteraceae bacterium]|nr:carbon-nitrogen hydrolase family protein [Steroidobacteraceae bacterium]HNS28793.1 carbon-nitrogen hydrolase family protein [Steroidobacteraceae bacterium]